MFNRIEEEIPEQFHSDGNDAKFTECSSCKRSLEFEFYRIEKAFRKYPDSDETFTAYECAICMNCQKDMLNEISEESLQNMQNYMQQNQIDIQEMLNQEGEFDLDTRLEKCSFSETPIAEMEEYNMIGLFRGDKMVEIPFVVGAKAIEEYTELLSEETKDFFDDFMNRINDLPPSLMKLFDTKRKPVFF